ncbi:hypothetical protein BC834DRAFT_674568 [Gloeopeniophorella convolvens]|nr:hypothetical protein BC834DRAFT_674568 [Gloeopeniophorella convolvens]
MNVRQRVYPSRAALSCSFLLMCFEQTVLLVGLLKFGSFSAGLDASMSRSPMGRQRRKQELSRGNGIPPDGTRCSHTLPSIRIHILPSGYSRERINATTLLGWPICRSKSFVFLRAILASYLTMARLCSQRRV